MKRIIYSIAVCLLLLQVNKAYSQDKLMESLGALTGAGVYNTYLCIGTVADGLAYDVYDADYTVELMQEQVQMARNLQTHLDQLLASGELVDADDLAFVKDVSSLYGSLATQADLLSKYANSGDPTDADDFESLRNHNWSNISKLLGFEE